MRITEVLQTSVAGAEPVASTIFIIGSEYDGKPRKLFPSDCRVCGGTFWVPRHMLKRRKTCSVECRGVSDRNRVSVKCSQCNIEFEKKKCRMVNATKGLHFCSRACKDRAQQIGGIIQPSHYKDGGSIYRQRAFRHYGKKCEECGYEEHEEMLDVNHRDGDRGNNAIENLQVLCVWHHAWITRMVQKVRAPVAHSEERLTSNQRVPCSNHGRGTKVSVAG